MIVRDVRTATLQGDRRDLAVRETCNKENKKTGMNFLEYCEPGVEIASAV